jgi:ABC-2 type transport system ATP-binding protein
MIKLVDLTKVYRGFKAVDHLQLEVDAGRVFGFIGPNGAGKTTTIKMMAGVLKPTAGQILIDGMDIATQPAAVKGCVGFIPDRPFVYEKLTGNEFLRFVAGLYGVNHASSAKERIEALLDQFELMGWENELIESYSHGMKQRLIMCSALVHDPKILIVDEPMVGLDPKGARMVKTFFSRQASLGKTIFMSTHSLEVAQEICQEMAVIQTGRIIAKGTADGLKQIAGVEGSLEKVFLTLTGE